MILPTAEHRSRLQSPGPEMAAWLETVRTYADYEQSAGHAAYGDWGQHDATLFLATGDPARAQRSIAKILANWSTMETRSRNETREYTTSLALHYSWLKTHLSPEQDAEFERILRLCADLIFDRVEGKPWGTRIGDSDEVVGHYFGLRLIAKVLDPSILELTPGPQGSTPAAMRADIARYCVHARGGEWVESDEYNDGTLKLLGFGAHAVGIEEFPEVAEVLSEVTEQQWWDYTPAWPDAPMESVEWGDDQNPHAFPLSARVALLSMLCGLGYDPEGKARNLIAMLMKGRGLHDIWFDLYRMLWVFDPDSPVPPAPPEASGFRDTPVGLSIHRGTDWLFACFAPEPLAVDHQQTTPDLYLWYRGKRLLSSVRGYMTSRTANNAGLVYGWDAMETYGRVSVTGDDAGCEIVWETGGQLPYWKGSHVRPGEFCHSYTRRLRFDAATKRITVTDSLNGSPPSGLDGYYPDQLAVFESALAPLQSLWHCPVEPTPIEGGYAWEGVKVTASGHDRTAVLPTAGNTPGNIYPGELLGFTSRFLADSPQASITTVFEPAGVPIPPPPPPPEPAWKEFDRSEPEIHQHTPTLRSVTTTRWERLE